MLLLDTSVLIDLEHELFEQRVGRIRALLGRRRGEDLACATVTVCELASGANEHSTRFLLRRLRKIPLTEAIAHRAGVLDREMSRLGKRLGESDNWIAATALHLSATLVFSDGDFERVPRLKRQRVS
ncbi:MAG TPA: type II toxin-antitoxin system VapC family toxin [Polyangia bacterium]